MRSTFTPGAEGRDLKAMSLQALLGETQSAFCLMDHADDEICQVMKRHPTYADRIWHTVSTSHA